MTNALEIHQQLTEHYFEFYQPTELQNCGMHNMSYDWNRISTDKAEFLSQIAIHKIPADKAWIIDLIWQSMRREDANGTPIHNMEKLRKELEEALIPSPSFEEYKTVLKEKTGTSAGGLTLCTYQMMRTWSPEYLKASYDCLAEMWTVKHLPEWWKWRWPHPIPKVQSSVLSLEKLRPIMLVEVTRKLWTQITIRRIQTILEKYQIFHVSQAGFRTHNGADGSLLQLVDVMESAQEFKQPLYLCSWDMSKAFDSPSKNLLKFAWTRLGVPKLIAEYLVNLDIDAHTVIRSPPTIAAFERDGYNAFHDVSKGSHCKKLADFRAARGLDRVM